MKSFLIFTAFNSSILYIVLNSAVVSRYILTLILSTKLPPVTSI